MAVGWGRRGARRVGDHRVGGRRAKPPAVLTPSDGFIVTWDRAQNVYFRRYDAAGAPLDAAGGESAPDIGIDSAGAFVIVTHDSEDTVTGRRSPPQGRSSTRRSR